MDEYSKEGSSIRIPDKDPTIPLSSAHNIIRFMNPYADEYLLYVYIDKKISKTGRLELYTRLISLAEDNGGIVVVRPKPKK